LVHFRTIKFINKKAFIVCYKTFHLTNATCITCPGCQSNQCDEYDCDKEHGICINDECVCNDTKCENEGGVCKNGKCDKCDHGKYIKGVCHIKCCRHVKPFDSPFNGGQFKQHCEDRCKWVEYRGLGTCFTPPPIDECNPNCKKSGGHCETKTGRCKCCKDFNGPAAMFLGDDIFADYCDVFCEQKVGSEKNELCVNPDYVRRLRLR